MSEHDRGASARMTVARRRWLRLAAASPLAALGGCVVAPYGPYHRPSTDQPGVTLRKAWCQGQAGPFTRLEIALGEGVTLSASAERPHGAPASAGLPLAVALQLPTPVPTRFAHAALQLSAPDGRAVRAPIEVRATRTVELAGAAWIDPARLRPAGPAAVSVDPSRPQGQVHWRADIAEGFGPARMVLDAVAVETAEGGRWILPAQTLRRSDGEASLSRYYRTEEQDARQRARDQACRRGACSEPLPYGAESFDVADASARWHGSWRSFEGRDRRVVMYGELRLMPATPAHWRPPAGPLTLRDPDGGASRSVPLTNGSISFADRVALDTPLHPPGIEGRGATALSIRAELPSDVGDFELRLPPLVHGTRTLMLAPIRFDQRRFDGGVEPFNC